MAATIEYYLTCISPFTYLGHAALLDLAAETGTAIDYRPCKLPEVFKHSGAVALPERPISRQTYRLLELQRWRAKRGVELTLKPKFFPTNPTLADCCAIAIAKDGGDPGAFIGKALAACWVREKDIAEPETIAGILREQGLDAEAVIAEAQGPTVAEFYSANTRTAIEKEVLGAPSYILNGERFWGQDRLELLADALRSGREPYRSS